METLFYYFAYSIVWMRRERFEEWLSTQFRRLNDGLPRRRLLLRELLEMEEPSVETLGGERHYFSREELEEVSEMLPERVAGKVRLPLVFRRSLESVESVYYLEGGEAEAETVKALAGIGFLPSNLGRYYTYKPIVSLLASKYPTLIVLGTY